MKAVYWQVPCLILLTTAFAVAADPNIAAVELSSSGRFEIEGGESHCMLAHEIERDHEAETLILSNGTRLLRTDVRVAEGSTTSDLKIEIDGTTFNSMSLSELIVIEAEARLDELSDDEYYAMHDEAEAVDGQSHASFDSYSLVVDDKSFTNYAKNIRDTERFPPGRVAEISVSLMGVPVAKDNGDAKIETASIRYNGTCKIAIMIE